MRKSLHHCIDKSKESRNGSIKYLQHTEKLFLEGNTLSVSFRKQQLKKLYEAINRYEDAIVDALKKDLRQKQGRKLYE